MGELVHVRLAGEVIRRRGERAVGALSQGRLRRVKRSELVGHFVGRAKPGSAGVVVVKFPGCERAVAACAALDFDHAGRPEVGPGEFFLASPDQLDRPAGLAGDSRGLDGRFAGVLAAVAGAGVRHDDANRVVGESKRTGQLAAHAEGALGSGPDGELAVLPLRHRRAGLERSVGDVGDRVGLLEADVRGVQPCLIDPVGWPEPPRPSRSPPANPDRPAGFFRSSNNVLPEIGGPGFHSALIAASARTACDSLGAATPTKSPSCTTTTSGMRLGRAQVDRGQRRPVRRGAQHLAVPHSRQPDVRSELVLAGHERPAIDLRGRVAGDCPRLRRADRRVDQRRLS